MSFFLFILNGLVLAGDISGPYPLSYLSFIKYHVVKSNWNGDIHTRTIKLEVHNTSDQTLSGVTALIDGYPEHVTSSDNQSSLGDIVPGATVISDDIVEISVDMSLQNGPSLKLIWQIDCDINGKHIMDETSVIETIE